MRAALFGASAWTDPAFGCVILSSDVRRAFDNIEFDVATRALLESGVSPKLTELLMDPLLNGEVCLRGAGGGPGSPFPLCRGARTG